MTKKVRMRERKEKEEADRDEEGREEIDVIMKSIIKG